MMMMMMMMDSTHGVARPAVPPSIKRLRRQATPGTALSSLHKRAESLDRSFDETTNVGTFVTCTSSCPTTDDGGGALGGGGSTTSVYTRTRASTATVVDVVNYGSGALETHQIEWDDSEWEGESTCKEKKDGHASRNMTRIIVGDSAIGRFIRAADESGDDEEEDSVNGGDSHHRRLVGRRLSMDKVVSEQA